MGIPAEWASKKSLPNIENRKKCDCECEKCLQST